MLFSSREPFNDDPQHNPTNPILTEFRELHSGTGNDLWTDAYLFWSDLIEVWDTYVITDHCNHAVDVLSRVIRLSKLT